MGYRGQYIILKYTQAPRLDWNDERQTVVMDFKQTNKPKKKEYIEDYSLQLVVHAEAHNEVYGTDIKS